MHHATCTTFFLQTLGSGFEVISAGKKKLVRSVPTELKKDHNEILELAQVCLTLFCILEQVLHANNCLIDVQLFLF